MRRINYLRHEGRDHAEPREGTLLAFVYDIPYLPACGILPPLHILNQVFAAGGGPGGLGPNTSWVGFTIAETEYRELVNAIKNTPVSALTDAARYADVILALDDEFDYLDDQVGWIRAVCAKHARRFREAAARTRR